MGTIINGILGGFSGKVGSVVGTNWRNVDVMRGRSRKRRSGSETPEQIEQRAKFSLATKFLTAISAVIAFGFKNLSRNETGYNIALAVTLKAVKGTFPELFIDYTKTLVTKGKLKNAMIPVASSLEPGTINFNWTDNSGLSDVMSDDQALLVAYCESLDLAVYKTAGAVRNSGTDSLAAKPFAGKEVET